MKQRFAAAPFFGATIVLSSMAFWPGLERPGETPREALLLVAAPLLFGLVLLGSRARPPAALIGLLAVPLLSCLLHVATVVPAERLTLFRDAASFLALMLVALAAASVPRDDRALDEKIEAGTAISLGVLGLCGLAQAWWGFEGLAQAHPPAATFVNRNVAAGVLVVMIPLAASRLAIARTAWERWSGALALGLGLAFLIATRTRGAWLGALVGWSVGAMGWLGLSARLPTRWRKGSWVPAALAAALGLAALFIPVVGSRPLPSVRAKIATLARPAEGTGTIRVALWRNTIAMIEERPWVGYGPGRFPIEYPRYQAARTPTPLFGTERQPANPENDPLAYAVELGVPAAIALLALLVTAIVRSLRVLRQAPASIDAVRSVARSAAIAAAFIHGLVSFPLHSPASGLLVWLLAGRAFAAPVAVERRAGLLRPLAGLALALVPLSAWVGLQEMRSQSALGRALGAHARGLCSEALDGARRVSRIASWRREEIGMAAMLHFDCDPEAPRALAALERALRLQPHQLNLLLAVGARRLKAGRVENADEAFSHALEIDPGLARAWLGLAMTRDAAQDRAGARAACERAVSLAPAFEPALQFCRGR